MYVSTSRCQPFWLVLGHGLNKGGGATLALEVAVLLLLPNYCAVCSSPSTFNVILTMIQLDLYGIPTGGSTPSDIEANPKREGKEHVMAITLSSGSEVGSSNQAETQDVLVKVDKFILLVDFVVLDIEEVKGVPIMLRRPFLHTAKAFINVEKKELTLRVQIISVTSEVFIENHRKDPLETPLVAKSERDDDEFFMYVHMLDVPSRVLRTQFKSLDFSSTSSF
ncbi:Uncharacterized protein TCM_023948 [Theobroma cacao]|uniref:Uncharacterized protein n=1 Tax=Theobroma cacao TaxID=3641 RepID=A0A061EUP5_THECC|nr:Uncharacterized protein TCM_023948 [Theobroma cacao]